MESTERLVRTWIASGRDEEVDRTVSDIANNQTTFLNVVKALGEYLTSEEDELRTKGVEFLSLVLARCPTDKFNRQAARVLAAFYCEKLSDTETVIPALKGLVTLTALPACSSAEATTVMETIVKRVKMRALVQSVRFLVFTIIDHLLAHHRDAMKAMGESFVTGYISLVDGEKDPRNLLVAFALDRVILIEFDVSRHIEAMFNITFCYFPITFRPPPNDPYGITTDDLRVALRGCLGATPAFGPLAIPLFLEKLSAGSPVTKRDALQTLASCLPVYGSNLARVSSRKLWNALKLEIFQPTDVLTGEEALKTTRILIQVIYQDEEKALETNEDVQGLAREACEECVQILKEPEKSQAKPAIRVLCTFMVTTPSISRYVTSHAIPHFVNLFLNPDEAPSRSQILALLTELVSAARESPIKIEHAEGTGDVPALSPYKDEVLGVYTSGLRTSESRHSALQGLLALIDTPHLFTNEELGFIVHLVTEILQSDSEDLDDSDATLDVLSRIATSFPGHIRDQTLPLLFASLPDQAPARRSAQERIKSWRILQALKRLCAHPELFEILVIHLTAKLDLVCFPTNGLGDVDTSIAYAHALLKTIADTLESKIEMKHQDVTKYLDRLVPGLLNMFVYAAIRPDATNVVAADYRLVRVAGEVIQLITQNLPNQRQESYASVAVRAFLDGNFTDVANGIHQLPGEGKLLIFVDNASTSHKNLLALLASLVVSLYKEAWPVTVELGEFLENILTWSFTSATNDLQRQSAWEIVASLVNKHADDLSEFLNDKLDSRWPEKVKGFTPSSNSRRQVIRAWIWMAKALLVRNHQLGSKFVDRLLDSFNDPTIGLDAARAIGELTQPDDVLTKRNHALIKVLHIQKFVASVLSRMISGANDATDSSRQMAYIVALTSLMKSIPKTTYINEMPKLLPLLLRGLELPDPDIRANVICTLQVASEGQSSEDGLVLEHAPTLALSMVKNSLVGGMHSVRVRIAALRYLGKLPQIVRYDVLHPYKATVIRELGKALDDPKRSVRKEAVDTRAIWYIHR